EHVSSPGKTDIEQTQLLSSSCSTRLLGWRFIFDSRKQRDAGPVAAKRPRPKTKSPVCQRIASVKRNVLNSGDVPQIGSVFVIQVVADNHGPLETFRGMIGQDVNCISAFVSRLQITVLRGEVVAPEDKARNGGRTVGSGAAPFILSR